jgi:hypothetical protein
MRDLHRDHVARVLFEAHVSVAHQIEQRAVRFL